jgi:hypothetical protein
MGSTSGPRRAGRYAVVAALVVAGALPGRVALATGGPLASAHPAVRASPCPPSPWPWPWPCPSVPPPTATPAPSATPSPAGSPSGTPSPSSTPNPTHSPTAAPTATPTATPVPGRRALPAPGPSVAVLGSDTIQISGLRSIAVTTVGTAAGPTRVIQLVANGSTIAGLTLQGPCVGHTRVDTSAAEDRAAGGLTIDATALQATILGIPIVIAAADLPEGQLTLPGITLPALPTDLGILTVKLFVLSIRSGAMALTAPRIVSSSC